MRIVSLVPSATETLFALGAGDLVVGRSAWCDWPPRVLDLPVAGDAVSVSAEGILGFRPDLVLVGSATQEEALRPLAGQTRVERVDPDSIRELREVTLDLARWTDREEAGRALVARLDRALLEAKAASGDEARPRVALVVQRRPLIVAGSSSWPGELLAALGAENVAAGIDHPWPQLSEEALVARDPEVILDAGVAPEEAGRDLSFWRRYPTVTAVREGRVIRARNQVLLRPGPRLPEALAELSRLLGRDR